MRRHLLNALFAAMMLLFCVFVNPLNAQELTRKWFPGHYVMMRFMDTDFSQAARNRVKDNPYIMGYKVNVLWNDIEKAKDQYDFSLVREFLSIAETDGKKLMIHLQDRVFGENKNPFLPAYLLSEEYEGGWYYTSSASYGKIYLPAYQDRWVKLIRAMGEALDDSPALAGIMYSETAMSGISDAPGYSKTEHYKFIKSTHTAMAESLDKTIFFQYVNWGFPNVEERDEMMRYLVEEKKLGFGGPDLMNPTGIIGKHQFGSYYSKYKGIAPICTENQPSGYNAPSARAVFDYALDVVGVHFLPWSVYNQTDRNYTFEDVLDVINMEKGRINTDPPSNIIKQSSRVNQTISGACLVWPNPVIDVVHLRIHHKPERKLSYQLYSLTGALLETKLITEIETQISIGNLSKGTYYIRLIENYHTAEIIKILKI